MNQSEIANIINQINASYGDALDAQQYDQWIDLFLSDCLYMVQSRENYDRKLPLALIRLEGHAMMRDRVFGCMDTIFHQPYYTRHVIGAAVIGAVHSRCILSKTNYAIFRSKPAGLSEVFNVGQYRDKWTITSDGIKLQERICVYDSEMILNALIYPV